MGVNSAKVCKRGHVGMYDNHRKCTECNRIDNLARYYANRETFLQRAKEKRATQPEKVRAKDRATYAANKINILANAKRRHAADPSKDLFTVARSRAKKQNCPFTITKQDIYVPTHCPLLGTELKIGDGKFSPASPTLDKIIPALGYVPDNIIVISHRANAIKNNAALEEMQRLVANWAALAAFRAFK